MALSMSKRGAPHGLSRDEQEAEGASAASQGLAFFEPIGFCPVTQASKACANVNNMFATGSRVSASARGPGNIWLKHN